MNLPLKRPSKTALLIAMVLGTSACGETDKVSPNNASQNKAVTQQANTIDANSAIAFINLAEADLAKLSIEANRAEWIYSNFITEDTAALSAAMGEKVIATSVRYANEAAKYANVELDPINARKLNSLRSSLVLPAPLDPEKNAELAKISSELNGLYGKGK